MPGIEVSGAKGGGAQNHDAMRASGPATARACCYSAAAGVRGQIMLPQADNCPQQRTDAIVHDIFKNPLRFRLLHTARTDLTMSDNSSKSSMFAACEAPTAPLLAISTSSVAALMLTARTGCKSRQNQVAIQLWRSVQGAGEAHCTPAHLYAHSRT